MKFPFRKEHTTILSILFLVIIVVETLSISKEKFIFLNLSINSKSAIQFIFETTGLVVEPTKSDMYSWNIEIKIHLFESVYKHPIDLRWLLKLGKGIE